ncbi:Aldo/keto reductase [Cristinia sonorae]|uniref:Aldo/keto reductase n=1 Tax=Cristinia sonorae TaxID=1940300 RepID=A0A8K0XU67_9AGAR|nr:Aldo/keto reductase [Cristinia sonorae]
MSSRTIPLNDGNTIPWLAFGTGTALYSKDATKATLAAISAGFVHLDGAQMYGNEETLGDAIVQSGVPRSSLFVTTKLAAVPDGRDVRFTLEESLRKLKTDYVDLFLIHNPKQHPDLKGTWKQLEALKEAGLTRSIGVSNFTVKHLETILEVATIKPAAIQNEYHPYVAKASKAVRAFAKEHNIVYVSYGGLTPVARFPNGPVTPALQRAAKRLTEQTGKQVTTGQVLQVWLRQQDIVAVRLSRYAPTASTSNKPERLQEYLDSQTIPDLTEEELKDIETEGAKVHHRVYMKWLDEESS